MPIFKVTQQQGNRVITSTYEAKSVQALQTFLSLVSTAKVKYIYEVHFEAENNTFPIDDFNYRKQFKALAKNKNKFANQVLIHNVRLDKSENEIMQAIKDYLRVGNQSIDEVYCSLFMK